MMIKGNDSVIKGSLYLDTNIVYGLPYRMTEEEHKELIDDVVDFIFTDYDHRKFNIIYDNNSGSITLEYKFNKKQLDRHKKLKELGI